MTSVSIVTQCEAEGVDTSLTEARSIHSTCSVRGHNLLNTSTYTFKSFLNEAKFMFDTH